MIASDREASRDLDEACSDVASHNAKQAPIVRGSPRRKTDEEVDTSNNKYNSRNNVLKDGTKDGEFRKAAV
jgi:hypothetical protein